MLNSILKLVGRSMLPFLWSASESCPFSRSGTSKDLGEQGSEDTNLARLFEEGSKILTSGLVINPNTCMDQTNKFNGLCYLKIELDCRLLFLLVF